MGTTPHIRDIISGFHLKRKKEKPIRLRVVWCNSICMPFYHLQALECYHGIYIKAEFIRTMTRN